MFPAIQEAEEKSFHVKQLEEATAQIEKIEANDKTTVAYDFAHKVCWFMNVSVVQVAYLQAEGPVMFDR